MEVKGNWKREKCCGTCQYYNLELVTHDGRVWTHSVAPCNFPLPELPPLPASIVIKIPEKKFMCIVDGVGCPTWKKRDEEVA